MNLEVDVENLTERWLGYLLALQWAMKYRPER
jgi:hypothetical protein